MKTARITCQKARMPLGEVIARVRVLRGMTRQQLQDACDVDQSWLQGVEVGKRLPSLPMVEVLATGLRTTPWALVQMMYQPEAFFQPAAAPRPQPVTLAGTLGERLQRQRLRRNLSTTELALKLGMPSSSRVCAWESGRRQPHMTNIRRLAEVLKCSVADLVPVQQSEAA